jgi:hypothetical protein
MIEVETILIKKAKLAMEQTAKRVADLRMFEQILMRVSGGEDLSAEIKGLKNFEKKEQKKVVVELIQRCKSDLQKGYWRYNSNLIATKVKQEFTSKDLLPRYKVEYTIETVNGNVLARLDIINTKFNLAFDTKNCKELSAGEAIKQAGAVLLLAMIG